MKRAAQNKPNVPRATPAMAPVAARVAGRPVVSAAANATNFAPGASMQELTAQHNLERVREQKAQQAAHAAQRAQKIQRAQAVSAAAAQAVAASFVSAPDISGVEAPGIPSSLGDVPSSLETENTIVAAPAAPLMAVHEIRSRGGISMQAGIFNTKRGILSAIIAQQILGPPLALAEQSIWNPR